MEDVDVLVRDMCTDSYGYVLEMGFTNTVGTLRHSDLHNA